MLCLSGFELYSRWVPLNGAWALNGRMFPDTPEVSQLVFLYIALEACLVNLELP